MSTRSFEALSTRLAPATSLRVHGLYSGAQRLIRLMPRACLLAAMRAEADGETDRMLTRTQNARSPRGPACRASLR